MVLSSDQPLFDARSRQLLRTLIAQYLEDGVPIGSRTLAKSSGLEVSPATIRNILADLEEAGLLASPHTSAGRIPTPQGLRLFVDSLIELTPLSAEEWAHLRQGLAPELIATRDILGSVSSLLSAMTHFAGVVSVPRQAEFPLQQIDFLPLSESKLLVILIFAGQQIQNRIIELSAPVERQVLEQAANYINGRLVGLRLEDIQAQLLAELRAAGSELKQLLSRAVELAAHAVLPDDVADVLVSGQTQLMGCAELADLQRLRDLFEIFQQKRELVELMRTCAKAPGVHLFIGEESGFAALDGCSVITAPYGAQGRILGAVGVVGPTRMAYQRVIPVVQATAGLLSKALNRAAAAL